MPIYYWIAGNSISRLFFCPQLAFSVFFWRLLNGCSFCGATGALGNSLADTL